MRPSVLRACGVIRCWWTTRETENAGACWSKLTDDSKGSFLLTWSRYVFVRAARPFSVCIGIRQASNKHTLAEARLFVYPFFSVGGGWDVASGTGVGSHGRLLIVFLIARPVNYASPRQTALTCLPTWCMAVILPHLHRCHPGTHSTHAQQRTHRWACTHEFQYIVIWNHPHPHLRMIIAVLRASNEACHVGTSQEHDCWENHLYKIGATGLFVFNIIWFLCVKMNIIIGQMNSRNSLSWADVRSHKIKAENVFFFRSSGYLPGILRGEFVLQPYPIQSDKFQVGDRNQSRSYIYNLERHNEIAISIIQSRRYKAAFYMVAKHNL